MASLGTLSVDIGARTNKFTQGLADAQAKAASFASGVGKVFAGIQISNMIDRAAQSVFSLGKQIVDLAANAELMVAEFETLTGNIGLGATVFNDLERFAARTSFNLQSAAESASMLLGKGVQQAELIPTMQMLGDLARGNSERLGFLAKAYTDVQAKGKLMAQEQNQFAENGINLFELLTKTTGKNTAELMAMREAGQITFQMVQEGLIAATAQGGKFFGFMQKANATFIGQWNSLMENIQSIGRAIGEMVLPYLKDIVGEANKLLDAFNQLPNKAEFLSKILQASMNLAIAYIRQEWDKMLVGMLQAAAKAGKLFTDLLNPMTAAKAALALGQMVGDIANNEAAQNLQLAQKQFADLIAQLRNQAPNAPVAGLQPAAAAPPKADVAAGFRKMFDAITPIGETIAGDARKIINDATLQGSLAINQIGRLFGFGTNAQAAETQAAQRTEFAAAAMRGSAEAYSVILNAMKGEQDPVVKATNNQTKELKGPLLDIFKVLTDAAPVKLLGSFGE
jgi:tape measure domain-containing protein